MKKIFASLIGFSLILAPACNVETQEEPAYKTRTLNCDCGTTCSCEPCECGVATEGK